MDIDGSSSPIQTRSSLPPSSAPDPSNPQSVTNGTPRRPVAGALSLEDDEGEENEQEGGEKRRRKTRARARGEVPLVIDPVGETLSVNFEEFLKT